MHKPRLEAGNDRGVLVVVQQVERKLAAILATDVADCPRLMAVDKEATRARFKSLRAELIDPKIEKYRGRIVEEPNGDRMLAEFGSAEHAIRCAIDMQRESADRNVGVSEDRRMLFRMGVTVGNVSVRGDGHPERQAVDFAVLLKNAAEPGGICLSRAAYAQCRDQVTAEFANLGERLLKNLNRPVRVYAIPAPTLSAATDLAPSRSTIPRLSVVVMPFLNLGNDREQDYFADGVTESLTTDLSRIPDAFVIGRNTAFSYKGKAIDARKVGRELGVRYVMEGSVQRGEDSVRVNAQLVDAETGAHVWAERFDEPLGDLLAMQDEIISRLARMVGIELVAAEDRRASREHPNNCDAIDLAMRARAVWNQPLTLSHVQEARRLFEAAAALDEQNVGALLGVADAHVEEVITFASDNRAEQIAAADRAVSKALALAPDSASVHFSLGTVLFAKHLPEQALREFELAISLDRNLAKAHVCVGLMKICLGRAKETEGHVSRAICLSPRDPYVAVWHFVTGLADLYLGRNVRAVNSLRQSVQLNPNWHLSHFVLAGALALAGLLAESAATCAVARRLRPTFSIGKFRAEAVGDNPIYLAQREWLCEGLRIAGVPDSIDPSTAAEVVQAAHDTPASPPAHGPAYQEFAGALRNALRDYNRLDLLAGNPLLRTRLFAVRDGAGPAQLQALLSKTVDALFASVRDEKLRRVIEFTYFQPAAKQEVTAERLGLTFGTYRRHLTTALDRLARWLWDRERRQ
jgi:TolB-like protein